MKRQITSAATSETISKTLTTTIAPDRVDLLDAHSKGVDGFSVETTGSGKHPFSLSSDSLTDAWAPTVHKLCTMGKLFVDYVMHSSFAYRQFNSNATCGGLMPFCRVISSTTEIVSLLVTTCACVASP
ncbi:hypothetical protein AVEN_28209-1 [Araneus ventricosus]|uniref:Uncharacterized protein n=1 Tax=Araneus ventricosus TaxID=182803 RepID=A0A4Y2EYX5_ARAVE|nr:hypothetical protein AVEN_28209-1 [Araneus ventricosus]